MLTSEHRLKNFLLFERFAPPDFSSVIPLWLNSSLQMFLLITSKNNFEKVLELTSKIFI